MPEGEAKERLNEPQQVPGQVAQPASKTASLRMPEPGRKELASAFAQIGKLGPLRAHFHAPPFDHVFLQAEHLSVVKAVARVGGYYTVYASTYSLRDVASVELALGGLIGTMEVIVPGITGQSNRSAFRSGKVPNRISMPKADFARATAFVQDFVTPALTAAKRLSGAPAAPIADPVGLLERLAALHDAGALTDDEFLMKKTEVLRRV